MENINIYDSEKLSANRQQFALMKVLLLGCGAVGSYIASKLIRLGVLLLTVMDFDRYDSGNYAKHCEIIREEDIGRSKAEALSHRVQYLLGEGQSCHGIDGSVFDLGPEAFAGCDAVFAALDNDNARMHVGRMIRRLNPEARPVLLMMGSNGENAVSTIMDNDTLDMSDLIGPYGMTTGNVVMSCTGRQLRDDEVRPGRIIRTSDTASDMAAILSVTQFRKWVQGCGGMNRTLSYYAFPDTIIEQTVPLPYKDAVRVPPDDIYLRLEGTVLEKTLDDALADFGEALKTDDVGIPVYNLMYGAHILDTFLAADECHCCGRPISVMKYAGRLSPNDLRCEECTAADRTPRNSPEYIPTVIRYFDHETPSEIRAMTLFELGFPLGAHIFAKIGGKEYIFVYKDDLSEMNKIRKL